MASKPNPEKRNGQSVVSFAPGKIAGKYPKDKQELINAFGGKGAHLIEMCQMKLPVPAGFTISTNACLDFYANNKALSKPLKAQISSALSQLQKSSGKKLGNAANPLLVSVRSGARVSMPGMMDTILNLGLNDITVFGLVKSSQNERFAFDCYRRFIQMYGSVVMGIDHHEFEQLLDHKKLSANVARDTDLTAAQLKDLVREYQQLVKQKTGRSFPQDVEEQLWGAISAVFTSWQNQRAKTYRRIHHIPEEWGTAVTVQAMVFGNLGDDCATGVCFTRNPSTGENILYGEYLINAQGEDVVAGIRTPQPIMKEDKKHGHAASHVHTDHPLAKHLQDVHVRGLSMEEAMPKTYAELQKVRRRLESYFKDMQDIEFTIERGKLYLLQTRSGKRTAAAAIKIAVDMVSEKVLSKEQAIARVDALSLDQLLHPRLDPDASKEVMAKGLPASPGAASGILVFSADEAEDLTHKGKAVILARPETSPEDIHGMHAAKGIVTTRGGMTSHAAVVARGMGRACVVGATSLKIDLASETISGGGLTLKAGDVVTIDGSTGEIINGSVPMLQPNMSKEFLVLMSWADQLRAINVRANADTPKDAETARHFGAEGIGLCRTEHMFFEGSRIAAMREMILSESTEERKRALSKLLPLQREDFVGIFKIMNSLPVTIRLLDPPLHEFLPHGDREIEEVSKSSGIPASRLKERVHQLSEVNPMLGLRGCRLGVLYPEIYAMQIRAIFEAQQKVFEDTRKKADVEIMIPLVMQESEFASMKKLADDIAKEVLRDNFGKLPYKVGSMIELPRAALRAGKIVEAGCEFFSFGTNDLTQTAMGLSRDDAGAFLPAYQRGAILGQDPFVSLDCEGVGELVEIAVERGRKADKSLKIGICGEHGGDPSSIQFFAKAGLDYVSCSPYRVVIARLAAAQASIKLKLKKPGVKIAARGKEKRKAKNVKSFRAKKKSPARLKRAA